MRLNSEMLNASDADDYTDTVEVRLINSCSAFPSICPTNFDIRLYHSSALITAHVL